MIILHDHSRKYRTRKFYLYPPASLRECAVALKFINNIRISLPAKMALALWLAHEDWLKSNPNRSK